MSSCVILDASTDCGPQFEGYPVLSPSISIFASLVTSQIESTSAIRDVFVQQYSCTNNSNLLAAIQSRRFHLSYTCSVAVNQAILAGCKFSSTLPPAGPILCSSQCSSAVSSLTAVFGDRTACPTSSNSSIEAQKDTLRNSFSNYCRNATNSLSSNSNLCIAGVPLETQNCGFMRSNDAVVGCQGISGDSCCSALLASVGNSTSTTTNSSKSSSSNTTIIVACSIVGALLLIVVIIASCVLGSKKRRQQQQQKHQQQQTMMMMNGPNMKQLSPSPALSPFLDEDFSKGVTSSNASFNIVASGPASASSTIVPLPGPANENNNHWTQNSIYYQQPPVPVSSPRANPPPPQQAAPPSPTAKHGQMGQPFPLPKLALPVTPPTANENGITDNTNSSTSESTAVVATPIKETATRVVVIHPYYPTLADELGLEVGCEILLMKLFDDGWGFGVKPMTGQQGAFPLVCVSKGLTNEEIENVKPEEIVTAAVMPQLSSPSSGSPINSSLKQQKVKSILQKPRVVSSVIPQLTEPKFSKRISSQLLSKEQMEKFGINAQRLSQLAISEKSPRETTVRPISMMHNSTSVSAPSASFPPTMVAMPVLKSQSPPSSPPKAVVQSLPLATTTNAADTGAGRGVSGFYDNFYVEESSQRIF